jgi:hypothetical protein
MLLERAEVLNQDDLAVMPVTSTENSDLSFTKQRSIKKVLEMQDKQDK